MGVCYGGITNVAGTVFFVTVTRTAERILCCNNVSVNYLQLKVRTVLNL